MNEKYWKTVTEVARSAGFDKNLPLVWKCRGYVPPINHYKLVIEAEKIGAGLTYEMLQHGV